VPRLAEALRIGAGRVTQAIGGRESA
jgi:hypothetical protein